MNKLHLIQPDGRVLLLQEKAPERTELVLALRRASGDEACLLEHVTVLFEGRRAHAFVHESGQLLHMPVNRKATFLYYNLTRYHQGASLYDSLDEDYELTADRWGGFEFRNLVHGPMLLWSGPLPFWEPEDAPWRDYETATPPFRRRGKPANVFERGEM